MDDAPHGVIYFSFGTIIMTSDKINKYGENIMSVLRRIPQHVLLKWEDDQPYYNLPKNVRISKWFPQNDILGKHIITIWV